jgi:hypothetical protein
VTTGISLLVTAGIGRCVVRFPVQKDSMVGGTWNMFHILKCYLVDAGFSALYNRLSEHNLFHMTKENSAINFNIQCEEPIVPLDNWTFKNCSENCYFSESILISEAR